MVGGESRKSKRLFPVAGFKAFSNFRRVSSEDTVSKNTNLKGLTLFIVRSASRNAGSEGGGVTASAPTKITSSENTGDVIVENTSMTVVRRVVGAKRFGQSATCRDRRTLSGDRLNSERELTPVHHQPESAN